MASTDWTPFVNQASSAELVVGATMAPSLSPPDGSFSFGGRALVSGEKFSGMLYNGFYPLASGKGGSIRAYLRKHTPITGTAAYAPMIFFADDYDMVQDPSGYILGLSEGAPYYIMLAKGKLSNGLKTTAAGKLQLGTTPYDSAQWIGLRLDLIHNPQGDLVLDVYYDSAGAPAAPVWARPAGISAAFVDDRLGVLSGSLPNVSQKYMGFGVYTNALGAVAAIDYVRAFQQLTP